MQKQRKAPLNSLMGIRFLTAMHVVLYHYLMMVDGFRSGAPVWLKQLVGSGASSVGLFLALSGFILTYNYFDADGTFRVTRKEFWTARFIRIYPAYLMSMLVYAPIAITRYFAGTGLALVDVGPGPTFVISGILCLFLLQSWPVVFGAWNAPTWTVSAEASFYSVLPWIAQRLIRLNSRKLMKISAALWVVSLIGPAWFVFAIQGHSPKHTSDILDNILVITPVLRCVAFVIGVVASILFLRNQQIRETYVRWLTGATATAILVILVSFPVQKARLVENCLTPFFAALIYLLAHERGWLHRFLAHPIVVLLGEASYPMYLLHNPLWNYMARATNISSVLFRKHFPVGLARPGAVTEWNYSLSGWMFAVYLVVLLALSILALIYIDRPVRAWLRRKLDAEERMRATQAVATA